MRFERVERYGRFAWTKRKQAMALSRPEREAAKLRKALPLLADQIHAVGVVDLDEEEQARQAHLDRAEQSMRALYARVWRTARQNYFAATEEQREAIRQHWAAWRGPMTCMYFTYVVDVHTGAYEERSRKMREREAAVRREVLAGMYAQGSLCLEVQP